MRVRLRVNVRVQVRVRARARARASHVAELGACGWQRHIYSWLLSVCHVCMYTCPCDMCMRCVQASWYMEHLSHRSASRRTAG